MDQHIVYFEQSNKYNWTLHLNQKLETISL